MQIALNPDLFAALKLSFAFNHFEAQKSYIKSRKKL
jgi:hypothetical protein